VHACMLIFCLACARMCAFIAWHVCTIACCVSWFEVQPKQTQVHTDPAKPQHVRACECVCA
jgi:hypothetical protein